jgi:hypothetical protein
VTTALFNKSNTSAFRSEHYERTVLALNPGTGVRSLARAAALTAALITRFATRACERRTSHDLRLSLALVLASLFSEQLPQAAVAAASLPRW